MLHTVIFIGRSGCGKGTQAALLNDRIDSRDPDKRKIIYIETGEKFRKFIRGGSFSSKLSEKIYESDKRQPDFLAVQMWGEMLIEELDENMHLVFDGAPRSLPEASILLNALEFYGRENITVVHIKVGRKWSEERLLSRGRSDDKSISKITKRLDWFDKDVLPAIEYFREKEGVRLIEVNGEQSIDKVHRDIISAYENNDKT